MEKNIYLIAMPIGNNNDISLEAIKLLQNADLIFCEDTRKIKYILNFHKITEKKNFFVINKFNENKQETLSLILKKTSSANLIVWVSDAGYPLFCDPGYKIRQKLLNEYQFKVVSGPSSILHALLISGMPVYPFYFGGFLNNKSATQLKQLNEIKNNIFATIVLFESVHRIIKLLENILKIFGDIIVCVCREISKIHETIYSNNISQLLKSNITLKGEFVIIFQNKKNHEK